jgi:hypothetical protein
VSLAVGLMAMACASRRCEGSPQITTDGVPKPKQYGTPMPLMGGAQLTSSEFSCCGLRLGAESQGRRFGAPVSTLRESLGKAQSVRQGGQVPQSEHQHGHRRISLTSSPVKDAEITDAYMLFATLTSSFRNQRLRGSLCMRSCQNARFCIRGMRRGNSRICSRY